MENWIDLIHEKLHGWWLLVIKMLPNAVLAIVVLFIFVFIARVVRNLSFRFVHRFAKSQSISSLASVVLYSLVIIFGIMTALDIMGLEKTVSSLLAGVGIIGLALGFAFQDLTANFISGAFIAFKRPFEVGHIVETNGFVGTIEDIQLRSTTLRTHAGLYVIIPNKDVFQKPIINYTRTDARRIDLEFSLPTTIDLSFLEREIRRAMDELLPGKAIRNFEFYFTAIEDPKVKLMVSFWTNSSKPEEYLKARHQAIVAIIHAFTSNNIYAVSISGEPAKAPELSGPQKG